MKYERCKTDILNGEFLRTKYLLPELIDIVILLGRRNSLEGFSNFSKKKKKLETETTLKSDPTFVRYYTYLMVL